MTSSIPKSGIYYTNRFGHLFMLAMEDELGRNGISAVLNLAGFPGLIEDPPPDNLERALDVNVFSKISAALEEMYGPRSGRAIARRIGWDLFHHIRNTMPMRFILYRLGSRLLPLHRRLPAILLDASRLAGDLMDNSITTRRENDQIGLSLRFCPVCWGRTSTGPICYLLAGLLEESMSWLFNGRTVRVVQTACTAAGDDCCTFNVLTNSQDEE